jgi:CHAT domain-containing protein
VSRQAAARIESAAVAHVALALVAVVSFLTLAAPGRAQERARQPAAAVEQAARAFQRGAFAEAVTTWLDAADAYGAAGEHAGQAAALTRAAQAHHALGQYQQAVRVLEAARVAAERAADRRQLAAVAGHLANTFVALGPPERADAQFGEALRLADEIDATDLRASILNNRGNFLAAQRRDAEALPVYRESAALARQTGQRALATTATINAARAARLAGRHQESRADLDAAFGEARAAADSHDKAVALISLGTGYAALGHHLPDARDELARRAAEALSEAGRTADSIGDARAASYAAGYLAALYEADAQPTAALDVTRRAIFAAQQARAPESLYRWQWQLGRLLAAGGPTDEALTAYRQAVATLQSIRSELSVGYAVAETSFRDSIEPLYLQLVDLLLRRATGTADPAEQQGHLREARDAVELLKVAELRDYFRDDCVDTARSKVVPLETVAGRAAVVYPIMLADRLEILVSIGSGLRRITVPVAAAELTHVVREYRRMIEKRTTRQFLRPARRLHDWLVRPLQPVLEASPVDTLVFVPDGPLRTIPLAALHDGERFLIERYALATTPSLTLTDPRPLTRERPKVLTIALTQGVQGFPPLPYVADEAEALRRLFGGTVLMDADFRVAGLERRLAEETFNIVHIATHGEFTGDVAKSFLLAFDGKVTMDRLDQFVSLFRFRDEPLELLTLSACETAAGDDRAALGLAGTAVKAGARSALATLWSVNDEASSVLVTEFYRELSQPESSRASALRRAQLKLLGDPRYGHPALWAPFLLINNWL